MWDALGLIGILLVFAGLHLLWKARHEIEYWLDRFLLIFRRSFDQAVTGAPKPLVFQGSDRKRELLPMLTGVGLLLLGFMVTTIFLIERIFF